MRNTDNLTLQEYTFAELEAKFVELSRGQFLAQSFSDFRTVESIAQSLTAIRLELARRVEVYVSCAG